MCGSTNDKIMSKKAKTKTKKNIYTHTIDTDQERIILACISKREHLLELAETSAHELVSLFSQISATPSSSREYPQTSSTSGTSTTIRSRISRRRPTFFQNWNVSAAIGRRPSTIPTSHPLATIPPLNGPTSSMPKKKHSLTEIQHERKKSLIIKRQNFKKSQVKFIHILLELRKVTLEVIHELMKWRRRFNTPKPFLPSTNSNKNNNGNDKGYSTVSPSSSSLSSSSDNYLTKIIHDNNKILRIIPLVEYYGFEVGYRNPFFVPIAPIPKRCRTTASSFQSYHQYDIKDSDNNNESIMKEKKKSIIHEMNLEFYNALQELTLLGPDTNYNEDDDNDQERQRKNNEKYNTICYAEKILCDEEMREIKKNNKSPIHAMWGIDRWRIHPWKPLPFKQKSSRSLLRQNKNSFSNATAPDKDLNKISTLLDPTNEIEDDDDPDTRMAKLIAKEKQRLIKEGRALGIPTLSTYATTTSLSSNESSDQRHRDHNYHIRPLTSYSR